MIRTLAFCLVLCCAAFGQTSQPPIVMDPPKDVPIPTIITSFAAKEKEFKQAFEQYTYTRDVTVRASCSGSQPGVYHGIVDVGFDSRGNRLEKERVANSTLACIYVTKEDLDSFRIPSLFLLTTDELQDYRINLVGQQHQDGLRFYVFDVSPVVAVAGRQHFKGRIWVDARDFSVVKSAGTVVDKKGKSQENVPALTTWHQQVDGRYWFPAQSRAHDVLHLSTGDVEIDEVIKLTDYKAIARK